MKRRMKLFWVSLISAVMLTACGAPAETGSAGDAQDIQSGETAKETIQEIAQEQSDVYESVQEVPAYSGKPYVEINDNEPDFTEEELTTEAYEEYSALDELGRCGEAEACISDELMPTEERESISSVTPTGWENEKYDNVDGEYLYNRCHLIGFQLTGENANEENLITGTRYMNTEGMLPFEDMVADYIQETENHVMYRVTPVFEGENLVASGVQMEAESVEDDGEGISFNVYVYNVQPDISIDYATGENWASEDRGDSESDTAAGSGAAQSEESQSAADESGAQTYIINENTDKFHEPDCSGVKDIKEKNKREYTGKRKELIEEGYEPCGRCKP